MIWIGVLIGAIVVLLFLLGYVKAPPNRAYIISGISNLPRIVIGKAALRIPFLERLDKLYLDLMQVDIKTETAVPTFDFINIFVDGVANVKISSNEDSVRLAAQAFLGYKITDIKLIAQQVLEGNMREVVGKMKLTELVKDREKFAEEVKTNVETEFKKMGMDIVNISIQNFRDNNGVIEDLGVDNIAQIRKDANIAKANADRDVAIAQSLSQEEANRARTRAAATISEQNQALALRQAELKKIQDAKQAEADAAYAIQEQEQRKMIEIANANADIAKTEREVARQEQEILLQSNKLDAEIKKRADAEKYAAEKKAEADLYTKKQLAEALRYAAEQESIGIKAVGDAQAEALTKQAEAQKLMGEVSILDMYFKILPEIVKYAAEPLGKTDKIIMYGNGNSTALVKDIMNSSSQILEGVGEATGINLKDIIEKFAAKNGVGDTHFEPELVETN